MKKILLLVCLLQTIGIVAQRNIAIIPAPAKLERHSGIFKLTSKTTIVAATTQDKIAANFFNDYLKKYYDLSLRIVTATSANSITLATHSIVNNTSTTSNEKYILTVSEKNISIVGNGNAGTFYGIQSLIQLLPIPTTLSTTTLNIQCLTIEDEPRFGYRGMHLDVSRHFFPIEYIKKYIDYIALHKMNTFHWHLTDDQGWRIEIKKYPKLTSVGGFRNGTIVGRYPGKGNTNKHYGGFYTQVEVKEIVAYAAKRYITVIPEIEMPGHASAAIAAYPQLSCFPEAATKYPPRTAWNGDTTQKNVQQTWGVFDDVFCPSEFTFNFLQDVLDEVMPLFPSNYIHIGGDECPKVSWKKSAFCQQLIKEKNFKDEHELQSYFIQRIEKYINSKGKQIIGWDEILEGGLAPNATVMSWRGEKGGIEAAKAKHNVIMTPSGWCYFDHSQTKNEDSVTIGNFLPLEKVYNYEPIPKDLSKEEEKYILGAQANVWAEYITNTSKVEYHIFPRMSALSEVLWSKKEQRNWQSFETRLPVQMQRYELWNANYSKAFYDIQATIEPAINENGVLLSFKSSYNNAPIMYLQSLDGQYKEYSSSVLINKNQRVSSIIYKENTDIEVSSLNQNFIINTATGKTISANKQPSPSYPGNGGLFSIVNGLKSEKGINSTEWCGWVGSNVEITIGLRQETTFNNVVLNILDQKNSWIYPPIINDVSTSSDGINYTSIKNISYKDVAENEIIRNIPLYLNEQKAKFIKFNLSSIPKIAEGLPGAGRAAWFFIDEIEIY